MISKKSASQTHSALKEWPAAINALSRGETILLFRKGGIQEQGSRFVLPTQEAILFPSFEHQKTEMLKNPSSEDVPLNAYTVGHKISLRSWVHFRRTWEITSPALIDALTPFYIWTKEFIYNRYNWKPERPLILLACQTFNFQTPRFQTFSSQYRGCKSWVTLDHSHSLNPSIPAIEPSRFEEQVKEIDQMFH